MKKILICNDGLGSSNKGDQAILDSMTDDIFSQIPGVKLDMFPYSGMRTVGQLSGFIRSLRTSDLFVLGGGHPFQDLTSQTFLFFGLFLILVAKLFGKKVICYAVGAGPIDTRAGKFLVRLILNKADSILVRDEVSKTILTEIGVGKERILVTADAAFTLLPAGPDETGEILAAEGIMHNGGSLIAVCVRRWFHFRHSFFPEEYRTGRRKESVESVRVKEIIADFIDYITEKYGMRTVLVPMRKASRENDYGQDDDAYSSEILDMVRHRRDVFLLKGDYSPRQLKGIFGRTDAVVSIRMHPLVLAASCGVPVIGIAHTASKGKGFFDLIDQPDNFISIEQMSLERLVCLFDSVWSDRERIRKDLEKRMNYIREKASLNIHIVKSFLGDEGCLQNR